jgi:broad-specificity NMP kinase
MGRRNYLIEGVSGAGKTAVCAELRRRGYQAIHGDRELVYRGDPETGLPMAPETSTPTAIWMSEHQIWDVEKVQAYVADRKEAVCDGSRNFAKFIDLFDGVFVLAVDLDTMNRRIDERMALDPTDFGGKTGGKGTRRAPASDERRHSEKRHYHRRHRTARARR